MIENHRESTLHPSRDATLENQIETEGGRGGEKTARFEINETGRLFVVFPPTHFTTILIRKLRIVLPHKPIDTHCSDLRGLISALARVSNVNSTFPPPPFQTKHIREQVARDEGQGELKRNGMKIVKTLTM